MVNWLYSQQITGKVEFPGTAQTPGLYDAQSLLVAIISPLTPAWRKAGYLRSEVSIGGEFFTLGYQAVEFGNSLIEIPAAPYRLSFDPVRDLTTIYPQTSISIYPLSTSEIRNIYMSTSYSSSSQSIGPDVPLTVVSATTATILAPANNLRAPNGLIVNNATKNLWVSFTGTNPTAAPPAIKVLPNGGNIDVPGNYTGAIIGIWEAAVTGSCVVHEFSYA